MIVVMTARSKRDNFLFNKITEAEKNNKCKKYQKKPYVNSSLRKMHSFHISDERINWLMKYNKKQIRNKVSFKNLTFKDWENVWSRAKT